MGRRVTPVHDVWMPRVGLGSSSEVATHLPRTALSAVYPSRSSVRRQNVYQFDDETLLPAVPSHPPCAAISLGCPSEPPPRASAGRLIVSDPQGATGRLPRPIGAPTLSTSSHPAFGPVLVLGLRSAALGLLHLAICMVATAVRHIVTAPTAAGRTSPVGCGGDW